MDEHKYSFTKEHIDFANSHMSERDKQTLAHFGYDKPVGEVSTTAYNTEAFKNIGYVIQALGIDETRKTRIIFDYDPNFAHCLLQINQSYELNN